MLIDVSGFATVQLAFDAAKSGDRLYFPSKHDIITGNPVVYAAPAAGWIVKMPLEIFGDGCGNVVDNSGTTILAAFDPFTPPIGPAVGSYTVFKIQAGGNGAYIHDLKIRGIGYANVDKAMAAIVCDSVGRVTDTLRFARVAVVGTGGHGLYLDGKSTGLINNVSINDCQFIANYGAGVFLQDVTAGYMLGIATNANWLEGVYASRVKDFRCIGGWIEGNQLFDPGPVAPDVDHNPQMHLLGCSGFMVTGCHFERFDEAPQGRHTALTLDGSYGGYVEGCEFVNVQPGEFPPAFPGRSILVLASSGLPIATGVRIGSNDHARVGVMVELRNNGFGACTNCTVMPQNVRETYNGALVPKIIMPDIDDGGNYGYATAGFTSNVGVGLVLPRVKTVPTRRDIPADSVNGDASYLRRGLLLYQGEPATPDGSGDRLNIYSGSIDDSVRRGYGWQSLIPKVGADQNWMGMNVALGVGELLTQCPKGIYRASVVQSCSVPSGNGPLLTTYLRWIDWSGAVRTLAVGGELYLDRGGANTSGTVLMSIADGPISYWTVLELAGNAIGSGRYDLRIRLEAL